MNESRKTRTDSRTDSFGRLVLLPETEDVAVDHPKVRSFLEYCLQVKPRSDFAERSDFEMPNLVPWLGNLMILDYLPDEDDFRYRLYGAKIVETSGFDMTGRLVSDFQSTIGRFFEELYRLALVRRALVFSRNSGVHARYSVDWLRVICPVRLGERCQVVACNYPVSQDPALRR